tara:strand:+ start:7998 stop:9080 length:1083 start_codon:yes stop_codon:yes gene_type:complete
MGSVYADSIGDIVESTGIGGIVRNNETLPHDIGSDIVLYDEARTGNGRMLIEFLDKEELALTEHTQVYIDEVYYDPNPSLSKMSIRMVQGTARFASGNGKKINKANIDITTPTAQIAINGTDFTTTIDELGRSLVVLLPDDDGQASGEIVVINEGGEQILNEPYQATMVSSFETPPTVAVTIQNITPSMINNMFIVNPPQEVKIAVQEQAQDDLDKDQGILEVDFLEFNDLETDELKETEEDLEYSALDIDALNVDLLRDVLDVVEALDKKIRGSSSDGASGSIGSFRVDGAVQGLNQDSQYNVFIEDEKLVFFRDVNGVIEIAFDSGSNVYLETIVEGYEGIILIGDGDDSRIIINQSN